MPDTKKVYQCVVTITRQVHDRNRDPVSLVQEFLEVDDTYAGLLEALALTKTHEKAGYEPVTVEFGLLQEILVLSETPVDPDELLRTEAWKLHEEAQRAKAAAAATLVEERRQHMEALERAELARLLELYPQQEDRK